MKKTVSEFGRDWDARTPRGMLSMLMGNLHVLTSDDEIEKDVRRRCRNAPQPIPEGIENECVAYALLCHQDNFDLCEKVVTGRLGS